jgi:hypothetical protein
MRPLGIVTTAGQGATRRAALTLLYGVALLGIAALFLQGLSYYGAPLAERPHHEGYWRFKSGGSTGHPLGVAGASMLVVMLAYSVRKRVAGLQRLGPLSLWLDAHILLGVVGPLLVVLHSAFKVQGLVALSFWSMVLVALSGVLGRFLYLQIPRTRAGEDLTLAETLAIDRALAERLRGEFGLDESALAQLDALAGLAGRRRGLALGLAELLAGGLSRRRALGAFERSCRHVPRLLLREFRQLVYQKARLRQRIALWDRLHELFHYWHVAHRPFAIVMYVFMTVHVVVALMTGYGSMGLR